MERREFLKTLAASASAEAVVPPKAQPAARQANARGANRPNFLIIMSDQHSPHVLGCYGDSVVRTPHLDELARRGVVFRNAYCASPLCVPSRMSYLTSQQPSAIRVWENRDTLASDIPTFAHSLGAAGYDTALIGRMHFLGIDQWHGFGRRLVGSLLPQYPNIDFPLPHNLLVGAEGVAKSIEVAGPGKTAYEAYDQDVTEGAIQFLREKNGGSDQPFCAVVGFALPHPPFVCGKDDWNYYYDRVDLPQIPPAYYERLNPAVKLWRKVHALENVTPEQTRRARAGYYGLVTEMDRNLGRILKALDELEIRRNTIVIYTSDHGEMAGEHGMWWKQNCYQASVSVPFIASWPGMWQPAERREVMGLLDVAPTLIELAGAAALPQTAGNSLVPLLRGENGHWMDEAYSEFPSQLGVPAMRMVRSGKWKLIYYHGAPPQLFNLETDPQELNDLAEVLAYAQVRETLTQRVLAGWSPDSVAGTLGQQRAARAILTNWALAVKPQPNAQWYPPPGADKYPL